jgi:hypothetical protein
VPDVPRSWSDVTPAWFEAMLGLPVTAARPIDLADGTNARGRFQLTLADHSQAAVFVKREGRLLNRLALSALGAREAEVDLARSGLDLPLEHPRFLAGAVDRGRLATVVVMEDVTDRGGQPCSVPEPLSVEAVAAGLQGLAALHDRYWERPLPDFVRPWRIGPQWALVARPGLMLAAERLRLLDHPLDLELGPIERGFRAWATRVRRGPQTLLHGDPHPGNTYTVDGVTGFYDWQLVRRGAWVHDVAYFVISALSVADRRAHERDLIATYRAALGRELPDAWASYCAAPVFGLGSWLQTLAAGGAFQPVDSCVPVIDRFAAAYRDLRTSA